MLVVAALVFLVIGSIVFHFTSPWWWTMIASNWGYIDDTLLVTFWIAGIAFSVIILFMAYCIFRFRHKEGTRAAAYNPESKKLESWLAIVTAAGIAILLAPGLFVWRQFVSAPADIAIVEAVGQQWNWNFRLPGKDGKLGKSDTLFVSADNPLGLNPNDKAGQDDLLILGDDLHLPVGKPVKMLLRSIDVIHNFYVPEFRAKMDLMPGTVTYFWLTPTRTGSFEIFCAGFCGVGHPEMRSNIIIETEASYQEWLQKQKKFVDTIKEIPSNRKHASAR